MNGQSDTVVIALALISLAGTVVTAILAYLAQREAKSAKAATVDNKNTIADVGDRVDGRLTELLGLTAKSSHAEGVVEGKANGDPKEVVVVNPEPVPVSVKDSKAPTKSTKE